MVYYKEVQDKSGKIVKNYFLTQGDTFQSQLVIKDKDGNVIDPELISQVLFKLSDIDYNLEYQKQYDYDIDLAKWTVTIPSVDTKQWEITRHIYEFEITYLSGIVNTPVQAYFTVSDQIQGG